MTALAARARGLGTTVLAGEALAAIELARDREQLVAALAHAGVPADASPDAVDRCARDRVARDLATLARWSSALALIELDEDRRSLRALVRGLAAGTGAGRRSAAAIATSSLPAGELAELAALPTIDALAERLARRGHPLAGALLVPHRAAAPIDVLAIEIALARGFTAAAARAHVRDRALGAYLAQVIDAENAAAALLLAERGAGLSAEHAFVAGGALVDRATFVAAAAAGRAAPARLARALAGTPLAGAIARSRAALDDAVLAWQLQTQARLRRLEPLGLAPAIHAVLRRRDEARRLRGAGWRVAMGAA